MNSLKVLSYSTFFTAILLVTSVARPATQGIEYSKQVPQDEVNLLNEDLSRPLEFTNDLPDLKNILGVSDLKFETLKAWLAERVRYVIADSEDPSDGLSALQQNYVYPNPNVLPELQTPPAGSKQKFQDDLSPQRSGVIMSNVGTNIYINGKKMKSLLGYNFQGPLGSTLIPVKSPRVGILQIGQGLFLKKISDDTNSSVSNSIYRLAILFHEAYHSDGHGKSLGFVHALCPSGPYMNTLSCDRETNGPYTAQAYFIRQAVIPCHDKGLCDDDEAERLAFVGTDALDRVIGDNLADPAPEGVGP